MIDNIINQIPLEKQQEILDEKAPNDNLSKTINDTPISDSTAQNTAENTSIIDESSSIENLQEPVVDQTIEPSQELTIKPLKEFIKDKVEARDFEKVEIVEINTYLINNIPATALNSLYIVSDIPLTKVKVFLAMYRLIFSSINYVENPITKKKLTLLLSETKDIYKVFLKCFMGYDSDISWGKNRKLNKILDIIQDYENTMKINKLVDIFLLFSEKQILVDTDRATGIELSTPEGLALQKSILGSGN